MNKVIYYSRGGNTRRLALAVGGAIGVKPEGCQDAGEMKDIENLLVCASIYAGSINKSLKDLLDSLEPGDVKSVTVFSTSASKKTARGEIAALLAPKGIAVTEEEFFCNGSFLFMHRNHPDDAELKAAAELAKKICGV